MNHSSHDKICLDGTKGVLKNSVIGETHRTCWDDEFDLIATRIIGEFNETDAKNLLKEISRIKRKFPSKKFDYLIDLTHAEKPSAEARKIIVNQVYKNSMWGKIATFGQSAITRTINSWMIKASGLKANKISMFLKKEEALEWLKK